MDGSTEITYVGNQSFSAYYNADTTKYSNTIIQVSFEVTKGTFTDKDKKEIEQKVYTKKDQKFGVPENLYYRVEYFHGIQLENVTLPVGYKWGDKKNFFTDSEKLLSNSSSVLQEPYAYYKLEAVYEGEENLFGEHNLTVDVYVVRGQLNAKYFAKTFFITYADGLRYLDIDFFKQNWPWSIKNGNGYLDGWNEQVISGSGIVLDMIYDPQDAIENKSLTDGGFLTAVYGNKENYNPVTTQATIYVSQARYTREEVLNKTNVELLEAIENTKYLSAKDLTLGKLNITLPAGFKFKDLEQKLAFGSNTVDIVYHAQTYSDGGYIDDPNYQTYGEDLSERMTLTLKLVAPQFTYRLVEDEKDTIVILENYGQAILRENGDQLAKNGQNVSIEIAYRDIYNNNEMVSLTGTAQWANTADEPSSEKLNLVNGALYVRSVVFKFDSDSKGILSGQGSITLKVYVKLKQIDVEMASAVKFQTEEDEEEAEQVLGYMNSPTLSRLNKVGFTESFLSQYGESINTADVFYEYELWQLDATGGKHRVDGSRRELLATDILDACGDINSYGYYYKIYAIFTRGSCNNFNFIGENPTMWLKIHRSRVSFEIANDIEVVYGNIDPMNTGVSVSGIENLNRSDYTLGVFDRNNNRISLSASTNVGEYTIKFSLNSNRIEQLKNNFIFDQEFAENGYTLTKSYTVLKKQISGYTLNLDGVLRQNGERLNGKISVLFDTTQFVDGNVPSYTLIFRKNGSVVGSVIEQGNYEVEIVFDGDNYEATEKLSFTVLPPDGQHTLVVVAIVLGVATLAGVAIGISVRIGRRNMRKNIQKQQMRRIKKELKSLSEKQNNKDDNIR